MSLKDTFKQMRELLSDITLDLDKSENGNKAASQRVRTGTVRLEKLAKLYRKESISSEKKTKGQKKTAPKKAAAPTKGKATTQAKGKAAAAPAKGKSAPATKGKAAPAAKSKGATVKATPKPKAAIKASTNVRPRQLSVRKATAKLPSRKR